MSRTVVEIETEIQAVKDANRNWVTDIGDKALITELTKEKNNISSTGQLILFFDVI